MVPFWLREAFEQAQRKMVLSKMPRRQADRDETAGSVPARVGQLQQGAGSKNDEAKQLTLTTLRKKITTQRALEMIAYYTLEGKILPFFIDLIINIYNIVSKSN